MRRFGHSQTSELIQIALFVGLAAVGAACGTDSEEGDAGSGNGPGIADRGAGASTESAALQLHTIGDSVFDEARAALVASFDAVNFAFANTGVLTFTGRVEVDASGSATYTETGGDDLVFVSSASGERVEYSFVIDRINGDGSTLIGEGLLSATHDIEMQAERAGGLNLGILSQRTGNQVEGEVRGTVVRNGSTFTIDLDRRGIETFEGDSTGASSTIDVSFTGSIEGVGFRGQVNERFDSEFVSSESSSALASTSTHAHTAEIDGRTLRFEDVVIRRNFRNGVPNDFDRSWGAQGRVVFDGETFGQYDIAEEVVDAVRGQGFFVIWLRTSGDDIELERWQRIP
ncbi:MAG: hypothetical protein AAF219_06470 [Myxococcota bacterium]